MVAVAIVTVVVLAVVVGLGLLIFRLQRKAQDEVPRVADGGTRGNRVVAVADDGTAVTEADDAPAGPRAGDDAFEHVLGEDLGARHGAGPGEAGGER